MIVYHYKMSLTLDTIRDIKIFQSKSGYRFSVDALLLYDFVNVRTAGRIADIGAGSGVVGLLLANRYLKAEVTLFELQESLAQLAEKNIEINKLSGRVSILNTDMRVIKESASPLAAPHYYDIAVSNPPFRKQQAGLINPDEERAIARHEIKLGISELVSATNYLLKPKGRFFLVYHPERLAALIEGLEKKMAVKRLKFVHPNPSSEAKIVLVEAIKDGRRGLKVERPFFVHNNNGGYSEEMNYLCYGKQ